ncbi:MAG: hypothetical protein IKO78_01540 [Bacilli bacterium]|nr:hypothetical protein [Bacilli bacterium]
MTTTEIIKKFTGEYGYVTDIKGLVAFLKQSKVKEEDINRVLFDVLKHNLRVDIDHKKSFEEPKRKAVLEKQPTQDEIVEAKPIIKSELYDVTSYINALKECEDDDFLTELLPSFYDANYDTIIPSILLYLLREIQLAHEMMSDEDDEYLTSVISTDRKLIEVVKAYNVEEESVDEVIEEHKNKLIFLRKPNGSLYVDDDLDEINDEEDMLPIIDDIENNRITKEKRFNNYDPLKGVSAIRKRDARIIFTRLDSDVIVVLAIVVKRFQNTQPYRDMLVGRNKEFKAQRDELKVKIADNKFINENQEILGRIKKELKGKAKELKVGDNNG